MHICISPLGRFDRRQVGCTEQCAKMFLYPVTGCNCTSHILPPIHFPQGEPRHQRHTPGEIYSYKTGKFKQQQQRKEIYGLTVAAEHTLTLSGWQLVSVQPQSLVENDAINPAGQVLVEFWQLHTHSNTSQHFVFVTDSLRCAGHAGGA